MVSDRFQSRVLLVGAGGIGCELLKDLVKSGFGEIHIIDLDTIDLSNLNRQFLFRNEHIKKPKALVAKEVAQRFNPNVKLVAHHANIKDAQFSVGWFSEFDLVFNALDNIDARRHVNRLCLAADIPLIESGTTGFNGQVQVIKKGKTACYDCSHKEIPKSFPVCTIRSTPSQPIHCIVWAKSYLLPELFGTSEDEVAELDTSTNAENAEEIQKLKEESEALKKIRETMGSDDFVGKVFNKVYKEDVDRLASMEDMWKDKKKPNPLSFDAFSAGSSAIDVSISKYDQQLWTLPETFAVFKDSLARLSKRLTDDRAEALKSGNPEPLISFDKDDEDTLDFVTAAANLRSAVFSIEPKSKFETKQMAGNIIPAIATTNAIIASLCVLEAYKVIKGELGRSRALDLKMAKLAQSPNDEPNPDCPTCGNAMSRCVVDFEKATLQDLMDILKSKFKYGTEFSIFNEGGGVIYDYMDAEDDQEASAESMKKKLSDFEVKDGVYLVVKDDEGDEPRVDLQLMVESISKGDIDASITIPTKGNELEIPRKPKKLSSSNGAGTNGSETPAITTAKRKRTIDDADDVSTPVKKVQVQPNDVEGTIVIDDEEGAIILDD